VQLGGLPVRERGANLGERIDEMTIFDVVVDVDEEPFPVRIENGGWVALFMTREDAVEVRFQRGMNTYRFCHAKNSLWITVVT
jgi:hypothetical protein